MKCSEGPNGLQYSGLAIACNCAFARNQEKITEQSQNPAVCQHAYDALLSVIPPRVDVEGPDSDNDGDLPEPAGGDANEPQQDEHDDDVDDVEHGIRVVDDDDDDDNPGDDVSGVHPDEAAVTVRGYLDAIRTRLSNNNLRDENKVSLSDLMSIAAESKFKCF